ncbi:MAG: choice-of-anchor D domain-containing protein, partial [Bacteroidales bacterium]|nr:choice-of-anchor D domain-containing protein [Bacteroidales bacterium]
GSPLKKAEINIKQSSTNYLHNSTYNFGNTEVSTNKDITFTIENLGLENLSLGSATVSGTNYSLLTNYSSPVTGGSTTTFVIRFTPSSLGVKTGSISIPHNDNTDSENPYVINFTGTGVASAQSDIVAVTSSEAATISSLINNATISTNTDGLEVWRFTIRDGGATMNDADNLSSIVTALTFTQASGNAVGTWTDAIQSIALFDGSTFIANGTVTATQISFASLNIVVNDNNSKTISVRLSLKNPLGADAFDNEDIVFGILSANAIFSSSGSGKSSFSVAASANSTNFISIIATKLEFTQQPQTTGVNNTMSTVVVSGKDANGNLDKDFSASVSISSTGTMTGDPISVNAVNGLASFTSIVHTEIGNNFELTTSSSGITGATSSLFDIVETTELVPGDLAILAFNTNNSTSVDEISFVCFKDLTPGTIIDITDNAYQKCGTPNGWGISEGWVRFERKNTVLPKGTIVTIYVNSGTPSVYSPDPTNWNVSKPQPSGQGNFDLNNAGEQIFFMTGGEVGGPSASTAASDAGTYSGYFLYGFNTKGDIWTPICGDATAGGTKNSDKPYNFDCFLTWPTAQADRNKYTGLLTNATKREWLDRINDPNNWTGYADNPAYESGPNYFGASITILDGGFSNGQWIGNNSTDWYDCGNWQSLTVPDETTDVFINSDSEGAVKIDYTTTFSELHSDIANCNNIEISEYSLSLTKSRFNLLHIYGDLTISGNGSLIMSDSDLGTDDGIIYLHGDWINELTTSAFDEGQSLIVFNGTENQEISLTTGTEEVFYDIKIDKSAGEIILNTNIEANSLNLTLGLITTGTNRVYVSNSTPANLSNHSTASYINGNLRRAVSTTGNYDLPVGNASYYELANIGLNSSTGLTYLDVNFGNITTPLDISGLGLSVNGTPLETLLDAGLWTITPNSGITAVNYNIGLNMRGATNAGINPEQHTIVKRENSASNWTLQGNHDNATQSISGGVVYAYRSNIDEFSDFAIAKHNLNILPIELISFSAKCNSSEVELLWSTASEINNDYFEVQKSYNASDWESIDIVKGAGNSNNILEYSFKDEKQIQTSYYRLKQVDFDGNFEYSPVITSKCFAESNPEIYIYPNPVSDIISITISNWYSNKIKIELCDIAGRIVYTSAIETKTEFHFEQINISNCESGVYLLRLSDKDNTIIRKIEIK